MTSRAEMQEVVDFVCAKLELKARHVRAVLELFDEGNTVPFVARYRKEQTGSMDEVDLRLVQSMADEKRALEKRREAILSSLRTQGTETEELLEDIRAAQTLTRLEDLYAPYRPRRLTRAQKAKEAGLGRVVEELRAGHTDVLSRLGDFTTKGFPDVLAVRGGVIDIYAESMADDARLRDFLRDKFARFATIESKKRRGAKEDPKYAIYLDFSLKSGWLKPHQMLAMRRGEQEGALSVKIPGEPVRWCEEIKRREVQVRDKALRDLLFDAVDESYKRLLQPQLERELRARLEASADEHAIDIFALNLKNLLLRPPLPGERVLGLDPGLRTGCKVALVDERGDVLKTTTLYFHDKRREGSIKKLSTLLERHDVRLVAVGNGTGTRDAQEAICAVIDSWPTSRLGDLRYAVVDEAGASVYSASDIAREEFPDLDVSLRGAVSIARRLQDPLAELVKIDPKSVGVGMYQHDVDQQALMRALDHVVEDVVHSVGVDLNSASPALLSRVAGIGPKLARAIVSHRSAHGAFAQRAEIKEVKGLGAKTFEQCAGFLRVREGVEPLDDTGIHPESYALASALRRALSATEADTWRARVERGEHDALASSHGVGRPTLLGIVDDLRRPGRDPREDLDAPKLRTALLTMDDLEEGMRLDGTVRNVVDFGAFVDIGVKEDGLVHVSKLSLRRVTSPYELVAVGDRVEVTITHIDRQRGRIGLSMIEP